MANLEVELGFEEDPNIQRLICQNFVTNKSNKKAQPVGKEDNILEHDLISIWPPPPGRGCGVNTVAEHPKESDKIRQGRMLAPKFNNHG